MIGSMLLEFQSLLSWIFLADQGTSSALFRSGRMFQSLLSWIFLADGVDAGQEVAQGPVSILVGVELPR